MDYDAVITTLFAGSAGLAAAGILTSIVISGREMRSEWSWRLA